MNDADTVETWLGQNGRFSQCLTDFTPRAAQLEMAQRVSEAIQHRRILLAEAGTGTGKTFAYLVPALLHSTRTLLSTGSKTLQDQLFHRDLPHVQSVLRRPINIALLKGRSNYLCHYRLKQTTDHAAALAPTIQTIIPILNGFMRHSQTGDRAELKEVPDDHVIWPYVTSNRENCLGNECPFKEDCFILKARREALKADLIVANHHLLLADFRLQDEGLSELLPYCDTVIVDEAHHLPELASEFFGESLSSGQWADLSRDILIHVLSEARDASQLLELTQHLQRSLEIIERHIDRLFPYAGRFACSEERTPELIRDIETFSAPLAIWLSALEEAAPRSVVFTQLHKRGHQLYTTLLHWQETFPTNTVSFQPYVHWLERRHRSWRIVLTPLNIGERFHERLRPNTEQIHQSWILTSATLAVADDFSLYRESLGLSALPSEALESETWASPFDYTQQALLYLPRGLPEPNQPDHPEKLIQNIWPLLCASHGRALLLFTSFRAMEHAWKTFCDLYSTLPAEAQTWLPLMQGQSAKADLLDQFARHPHPILFGSHSFWEGVDLPGRQLSLLVIDRIPFMPPEDPITSARLAWLKQQGRNPFMEYQLPHATLTLKQGVGRLIRREQDEGVVVLGDPRLRNKFYGRRILNALPPMKLTTHEDETLRFLEKL